MRVVLAIIITAAVVVGIAAWIYGSRRTARLRRRFGPEYDRLVQRLGSRRLVEAELAERCRRVEALHVRELDPRTRARLAEAWQSAQVMFADDPGGAARAAEKLPEEAIEARGYPIRDPRFGAVRGRPLRGSSTRGGRLPTGARDRLTGR